jgi:hypothetical protein
LRKTAGCGGRRGGVSSDAAARRRRIDHTIFRFRGPIGTLDILIFQLVIARNSAGTVNGQYNQQPLALTQHPESCRLFLIGYLDSIGSLCAIFDFNAELIPLF